MRASTPASDMRQGVYDFAERLMGMTEEVWARHANPWSVWTRMTCLPLLVLAIYARLWLGWWALPLVALALIWTWYNPRAFPPPQTWDSWATKATLGERVLLRHRSDIAPHHLRASNILSATSGFGLPPLIYGLVFFEPGWTVAGLLLIALPKLWFCDRMVWIWQDWTATGNTRADLKSRID